VKQDLRQIKLLRDLANEVRKKVLPIAGTSEAGLLVGRIGAGGDQVKKIDEIAEKVIVDKLREMRIECALITEDSGKRLIGENPQFTIIADAIDGTTNAILGIPYFTTSLALVKGSNLKSVEAALVMNIPDGVTYSAVKGSKSIDNSGKASKLKVVELEDATVCVHFGALIDEEKKKQLSKLLTKIRDFRYFGSASLELCYVASGLFDAFVDLRNKLRLADIAAAKLIVEEAGGQVASTTINLDHEPLDSTRKFSVLAASSSELLEKIINTLFK
jgi:myo-inositol-1(or 4)-monophosphatase